jgi:TonB family protein
LTVFAQSADASGWNISNLLLTVYFIGVVILSILFIIKLLKISLCIIQSSKNRNGKYIYIKYDENMTPFSFFNYIFINADAYNEEDNARIMLHEQIHVQQRHSWDLIFVELASILLWFNPILILYKRSLQVIHEYLADHRVLQHGFEQGAYLNLLLRQLTLQNVWMLGHHFNYLLTKNRFKMLKKNHYSKWAIAKSVYVLPFIALLLMLNCKHKNQEPQTKEYQFTLENTSSDSTEEVTYEIDITRGEGDVENITVTKAEEPLRFVEMMPEPIGGLDAMYKFMQGELKYPAEAREKGIAGQVFLEFVVEKDGSIGNVKVVKGVHSLLDAEALRVVKMLPKWKPGTQNGKPVRCFYNIPVRFTIN